MLWTPGNSFGWSASNFGASYASGGLGTNSPGHANANTKGANTALLGAIAEDAYGLSVLFTNGATAATARRNLVDILIDPAGGTSWSVLIANLLCCGADLRSGGYWYYFPIYLKAGTAIGSANQSLTATTSALQVAVRVYGKPSRPELLRVGTRVYTFGAVTASTSGTAVTPGTAVMGSLSASFGTTANDLFWWQAGFAHNDTSVADGACLLDVLAGDGTNNVVCSENIPVVWTAGAERYGKAYAGAVPPFRDVPSGSNVYMRGAGESASETTPTGIVYGVG